MGKKKDVKKVEGGNAMIKQPLFVPSWLWSELLTIANYPFGERKFDGKIWKVLEYFLELHQREAEDKKSRYEERLKLLEDRLQKIENEVYNKQSHENETVRTFAD